MKTRTLWLSVMVLLAVFMEGLAVLSVWLAPNLYDHREAVFARFSSSSLQQFVLSSASPTLGWDLPPGRHEDPDCVGGMRVYTVDASRNRVHGPSDAGNVRVLVAGDSYTFGAEADDLETFPAVLERRLGLPVANLGVGGYDPTQALLKLEETADRYPGAQVAVLAIMYENLMRMLNSYRPIYFEGTGPTGLYGFKPYMRDGMVQPLIAQNPWRSMADLQQAAELAFDTDYWRKPRARFPYTVSLARAVAARYLQVKFFMKLLPMVGQPSFANFVSSPELQQNLSALVERFASFARKRKLTPVLALIPLNGKDTTSGAFLERVLAGRLAEPPLVVSIGQGIDWSRYTLGQPKHPYCHPSAYGYAMIAENLAAALRPLLGPAAVGSQEQTR